MSLHSPGDVVYLLKDAYEFARDNWAIILGLLVFLGGGSAFSFKVTGLIEIIKNVFLFSEDVRSKKLDNDSKELDLQLKRLELKQKIKDSGINPESLVAPLEDVVESTDSLEVEPIVTGDSSVLLDSVDENEESIDIEDL